MLTCRGDTFAGRVGASLVLAASLPELVANSLDEYRARLLALAADRAAYAWLPRHLEGSRDSNPLFDTKEAFARDWETLLLTIYDDAARATPKPAARPIPANAASGRRCAAHRLHSPLPRYRKWNSSDP
jgi:hypothetical protein